MREEGCGRRGVGGGVREEGCGRRGVGGGVREEGCGRRGEGVGVWEEGFGSGTKRHMQEIELERREREAYWGMGGGQTGGIETSSGKVYV